MYLEKIESKTQKDTGVVAVLGFRSRARDFLFENEWKRFLGDEIEYNKTEYGGIHIKGKKGVCKELIVVFSRDFGENKKIYVQEALEKYHRDLVEELLEKKGVSVMICGRSHPFPSQLFDSICHCLATTKNDLQTKNDLKNPSEDELKKAQTFLENLKKRKKYILDTWG
eukprot:Trichotokara_eunicae@DN6282_c0_g2_i1.p1